MTELSELSGARLGEMLRGALGFQNQVLTRMYTFYFFNCEEPTLTGQEKGQYIYISIYINIYMYIHFSLYEYPNEVLFPVEI